MTKQRHILLWAILSFLVTSCTNLSGVLANQPDDSSTSTDCDFSVQINEVGSALPGETVFLVLNKTGFGWEYSWSTTAGVLSEPDSSTTAFTAPDDERTVTVSVEVTKDDACAATDKIEINVANPVTLISAETTDEETAVVPTATITIMPTATSTETTTPMPEPSSTPTPTLLPESPATPTLASSPTNPPVPTATPQPVMVTPVITDYEIMPGGAIVLAWSWDDELDIGQNFAVRFWFKADPRPEARYSITWTKEHTYEFSINSYPPGEYLMNVAVMTGPSDGEHHEIVRSADVQVYVPPVEPTPLLQCPPVCTDP